MSAFIRVGCDLPRDFFSTINETPLQLEDGQVIGISIGHEAGANCADLYRKYGRSEGPFYHRKAKFGGMTVSEAKRLKAPQG